VAGDAPLYGGLDSIKHADIPLADAERRAAELWGADWCRFSVAGSTHGNQALTLAVGGDGRDIIVTRILHRSLLLGLVLAGLRPVWVRPEIDVKTGLPGAVAVDTVRSALREHPDACGVFLGDPSYVGTIGDLAGHAAAAHQAGVPLMVDQAWAAHFGFHPDLPPHAIQAGADALVTSAHKALPAYTQGAIVLARTERLQPGRLNRAFEATHTTSPAGSITASIDASRALLARDDHELCGNFRCVASAKKQRPGPRRRCRVGLASSHRWWFCSRERCAWLCRRGRLVAAGMAVESADKDTVIPIVTIADGEEHVAAFVDILIASIEGHRSAPRTPVTHASWTVVPETVLSPREAFFADNETVPASVAAGRVSAELIAPYPPGVPVLAPGELITAAAIDSLREVKADGGRIARRRPHRTLPSRPPSSEPGEPRWCYRPPGFHRWTAVDGGLRGLEAGDGDLGGCSTVNRY
jgi:lysine decarboxylase